MNIQLRDSKHLQDAIYKRAGKKLLPKAQLHPELQNGLVDSEREGFTIRSEILVGEQKGEANPLDAQHLTDFLPTPATCTAKWKIVTLKQGDAHVNVPLELSFDFDGGGKIVCRTQAAPDVTKLTSTLPTDRIMRYDAECKGGSITFTKHSSEKPVVKSSLSVADLQTLAPQLGVEWDKSASLETNTERIQAAIAAKGEAKAEPVKVKQKAPAAV